MENDQILAEKDINIRVRLVLLAFILFTLFVFGMVYLATNPATTATSLLAYAAGLSVITLPCTFPLVFVIVPMSMGRGYRESFLALIFVLAHRYYNTLCNLHLPCRFMAGYGQDNCNNVHDCRSSSAFLREANEVCNSQIWQRHSAIYIGKVSSIW